jgi:TRAP-type C4-dicarboxylate transport system substrate-binding protein
MMNLELYNTLSAEDQQILQQAATIAAKFITNDISRAKEGDFIQQARDLGVEVIELTPEQMAINAKVTREEVWPELEKETGKVLMDQVLAYAQPLPGG